MRWVSAALTIAGLVGAAHAEEAAERPAVDPEAVAILQRALDSISAAKSLLGGPGAAG